MKYYKIFDLFSGEGGLLTGLEKLVILKQK